MSYQHFFDDNYSDEGSGGNGNGTSRQRSLRERPPPRQKHNIAEKRIEKLKSKFLEDFDPEQSSRERRKLSRKNYGVAPPTKSGLFDEKGRYRSNGANVCDCLDQNCEGCHFPCVACRSPKCGTACRITRKWAFESIEHDGKDLMIKNKNITVKTQMTPNELHISS